MSLLIKYIDGSVRVVNPTSAFTQNAKDSLKEKVYRLAADTGIPHSAELLVPATEEKEAELIQMQFTDKEIPVRDVIDPRTFAKWRKKRKNMRDMYMSDLQNPTFSMVTRNGVVTYLDEIKQQRKERRKR